MFFDGLIDTTILLSSISLFKTTSLFPMLSPVPSITILAFTISSNIVFIDESYDKNKRVFSNKFLRDICYVDNKCDIINKIRYIKSKPVLREEIINLQREDTKLDIKEYENNLTQLIRWNDINEYSYYEDFDSKKNINDILTTKNWNKTKNINFGYSQSTFWIKFNVKLQ